MNYKRNMLTKSNISNRIQWSPYSCVQSALFHALGPRTPHPLDAAPKLILLVSLLFLVVFTVMVPSHVLPKISQASLYVSQVEMR